MWHRGNVRQNNFIISVSNDGNTFTDLIKGTSTGTTTSLEEYNEIPVGSSGRYLRVTVNGNTENNRDSIPEIAVYGASAISAGDPGPLFHKWQNTAGTTTSWSAYQHLSGSILSQGAVAINPDGRLEVFAIAANNQLYHRWQNAPGSSSWSAWTSLGGDLIGNPAVIANQDGRLEVFVVAANNQLYHRWQNAPGSSSWSAWVSLGGNLVGNPAVAINSDGRLEVFAIAANNQLYHKWQNTAGTTTSWSAYQSLGGSLKGDPAVTRNNDGRLEVFVIGTSNSALYHKWQNTAGTTTSWSAYQSLGGSLKGDPAVTRNNDGRLEVFVIGTSTNALYHKWQNTAGTTTSWSAYHSLGGTLNSNPVIAVNADGRLEVFVIGTSNSALYHKWQNTAGTTTSWSAYQSLGGSLKGDPAVARNSDGRLEVFVIGEGSTSKSGILLPLYMYPTLWQAGNPWEKLANIAKAHPTIQIHAIINPNSGPGTQQDSNFVNGIDMLKAAGVKVWGYTYTQYGARPSSDVKSDIDKYATFYPGLHGIIFDQMENQAGSAETYYTDLTQYTKSRGFVMTGGNPGAATASSYVGTTDTLTIYEDSSIPSSQTLASRTFNGQYDKKNFNYVSYAVSSLNEAAIRATLSHVGFLYVTNDVPPNPWDTLPSYFEQLVGILES